MANKEVINMDKLTVDCGTVQDEKNSIAKSPSINSYINESRFRKISNRYNQLIDLPESYKQKLLNLKFNSSFDIIFEADEELNGEAIEQSGNLPIKRTSLPDNLDKLNTNVEMQSKSMKKCKMNILNIGKKINKMTSKIEKFFANDLYLQQQLIICDKFLSMSDSYMYQASSLTNVINYNRWFSIFQGYKIKLLELDQGRLINDIRIFNEDLLGLESEFDVVKKKIETEFKEDKLSSYSKMTSNLDDKMWKIKNQFDKKPDKLNRNLEQKYRIAVKIHGFCLQFIELLDDLVFYFIIPNFDFAKATLSFRNELLSLAKHK